MKQRGTTLILAVGLGATALLTAPAAHAQGIRLVLHAPAAAQGAEGLLVSGRGPTFSRAETLDALEDVPRACPCPWTVYVTLPRAEQHHYDGLERVWITGPGYPDGSALDSDRTRIPGLVSVFDLEPTADALVRGDEPPVTSRAEADLSALQRRLDRAHDTRTRASLLVAGLIALFAVLAFALRSAFFGRAALLAGPIALAGGLLLSALEVSDPWPTVLALIGVAGVGALAAAAVTANPHALAVALLAIFPIYLVTLSISPETGSFAAIGARPENGGRFYGFQNQIETMLLVPGLLGAALIWRRLFIPVALLVLVTVGASFAGADGGGLLVFAAGYVFLWLRLRDIPLTARNLAFAGIAGVAIGALLVGIDAALGGSSHVTRALEGGPIEVLGDIAHRLRLSAGGLVSSFDSAVLILASLPVFALVALRRPRFATVDAVLVALAVSLLVNDSPRDVASWGALSCAVLRIWEEARRVQ